VTGYALEPPTSPSAFALCGVAGQMTSHLGDIRDLEPLQAALRGSQAEIVFHLAAQPLVLDSYQDPVTTYATNVMGTVNLLEAVRQCPSVKACVVITTDKCYENKEWIWGYRENDRLGGHDPYSNSKGCAELVTQAFRDSFFHQPGKTLIASVRAGNVIGGGDFAKNRLIPDCAQAWTQGETVTLRYPEATRPWQFVLEPLAGYLLLAERLFAGETQLAGGWNFGPEDADVQPVGQVVKLLAEHWGASAKWEIQGQNRLHEAGLLKLDCSKAKAQLGWHPRWSLSQTLASIAHWYQTFAQDPTQIPALTQAQIHEFSTSKPHHD